jgi:hypothetical protein
MLFGTAPFRQKYHCTEQTKESLSCQSVVMFRNAMRCNAVSSEYALPSYLANFAAVSAPRDTPFFSAQREETLLLCSSLPFFWSNKTKAITTKEVITKLPRRSRTQACFPLNCRLSGSHRGHVGGKRTLMKQCSEWDSDANYLITL